MTRSGPTSEPVDQAAQLAAWEAAHTIGAAWTGFLQEHPIVLSPVCCERPWIVGEDIDRVDEIAGAMRMVVPVNVLGLPACAVPVGSDEVFRKVCNGSAAASGRT